MRISRFLLISLMVGLVMIGSYSCRKNEKINTSPDLMLSFSTDTVLFDTVFATVGSVTRKLIVYNLNKNKVNIASIKLAGGTASNYRLNINGNPVSTATDVEIPGEDSLYIFVRVTVDPNDQSTPYVVTDSIEFITNTNPQQVKLVSWGQDAIFHSKENLNGNIIWDSLKAHVIYDWLRVDTSSTLTILPGTKVYFHMNGYMAVSFQSTLKIPGTIGHPVRFQGDRLDPYYKDLSGQWKGIYLEQGSIDHDMNYVIIKNGMRGIIVDSLGSSGTPMLTMSNCIIQNMAYEGIYAYGTSIKAVNCVIGNCGTNCLSVNYGGEYDFSYLTIGNYWYSSVRNLPSLYVSNYTYDDYGRQIPKPLLKASFTNVIVYGSNEDEIGLDSVAGVAFNYLFDHAILKTSLNTSNQSKYNACMVNKDPRFVDEYAYNYQIDSLSPAIKAGKNMNIPFDIMGVLRGDEPALGAYEYRKKN